MNKVTKYIVFIFIGVILGFIYINKNITPYLISNSEIICSERINKIVNDVVKEEITKGYSINKLFIITYENNDVSEVDFDTLVVNRFLTNVTSNIRDNKYLNDMVYIRMGILSTNTILANMGPKVPLKLKIIDTINSNIRNNITNFGINSALLETYLDINIKLKVVLPFTSEVKDIKLSYPIAIKIINGSTPKYFSGTNNSSFSLPVE